MEQLKCQRRRLSRIRPGMKCADILRSVRNARNKMTTRPDYFHVFGHMGEWLREDQLTFQHRLNKRCDELAKAAVEVWVARRMARVPDRVKQLLLFESEAVLNSRKKITENIAETIRFAKGMEEARNFLVKERGWSDEQFDEIDWTNLHCTLKCKPDGYVT